jgi:hypothetical protein
VSEVRLPGWRGVPRVGVLLPEEGSPGWTDAALWWSLLEAWGVRAEAATPAGVAAAGWTTLVVPAAAVDERVAASIASLVEGGLGVVLAGSPTGPSGRLRGLRGVVEFEASADLLQPATSEGIVDDAEVALAAAAPAGLVFVWRWPEGRDAGLVVDGDVDHPTGVDPECSRYVAPALETARRAGYGAYGIFAAAANVEAEPGSFPPGVDYYNHSFTHPYSYWNDEPWEALDEAAMRREIERSAEAFGARLGVRDQGIFRLPHFQLEACGRTYDVLESLGYRADSSIGGNVSITGGLPYHPARRAWSDRPQDAAYARSHPDPGARRPFLQLPISTDPTAPDFPHGCCSYNTLGEGVRNRTADPSAYEEVLQAVLDRETGRRGLAHLFIDPPDAGFGRLSGDRPDYASAVERWLARAARRSDLAIMTTAELTTWWLARESAVGRLTCRPGEGGLVVDLPDPPPGTWIELLEPGGARSRMKMPAGDGGGRTASDRSTTGRGEGG